MHGRKTALGEVNQEMAKRRLGNRLTRLLHALGNPTFQVRTRLGGPVIAIEDETFGELLFRPIDDKTVEITLPSGAVVRAGYSAESIARAVERPELSVYIA